MTNFTPRLSLALLAATALAGCASPQYPIQLGQAPAAPSSADVAPRAAPVAQPAAAREDDPIIAPQRTAPVEIQALEPPAAAPRPRAEAAPQIQAERPAEFAALTPRYPTRLPEAETEVSDGEPHLILAATRHRTRTHAAPAAAQDPSETYTVKKGDTLGSIADKLGVGLAQLKAANGLKKNAIHPGQVLKNPKAESISSSRADRRERAEPARSTETYKVKRGDTLFSIAKRFHVTDAELRAANGIGRRGTLQAGQTLKIHGGESEAPMETAGADESRAMASDRGAAGRIVDIPGSARSYKVRKGDTLSEVADRLDTSVETLAKLNHLKKPYHLKRGQIIRGKATGSAKAYVVARGDTLATIAERFEVSETALRGANGLKRGAKVAAGRKLKLPVGFRDRDRGAMGRSPFDEQERRGSQPRETQSGGALPNGPQPYIPPRVPSRQYFPPPVTPGGSAPSGGGLFGAPTQSPTPSDAQLSQMGKGIFIWPLRGEILSTFGPKAGGVGNDGLNIRAAAGASVTAAAAGDVIYAGDQVPGYGNLVLIRHADGWVTAYGHLSRVDVRMQQKVIQGQQIGQAGQTGGVSETQLHFEVRYQPNPQERAKPIDPQIVLPR